MNNTPMRLPHAAFHWRGTRNHRQLWAWGLGGVALAALGAGALRWSSLPAGAVLALLGGLCAFVFWWVQVESLLQQNSPRLARLVPGHPQALRRSLRHQALGLWALSLLVALPFTEPALVPRTGLVLALVLGGMAPLVRAPLLWLPLSLAWMALMIGRKHWQAQAGVLWAALADPALSLPLLALLLALLGLALGRVMGDGNAAHRRHQRARERARIAQQSLRTGGNVPTRLQTGWSGAFHRLCEGPWRWRLHRRLRVAHRPQVDVGHLLIVLAGAAHWARQLGVLAVIGLGLLLPLLLVAFWLPGQGASRALDSMRFGVCIAIFGIALNPLLLLPGNLQLRQRERGLLRLIPGAPQGAALRRAWCTRLALQAGLGWLVALALCLGPTWLWAGVGAQRYVAGFAGACLPFLALAWRDWEHLPQGGRVAGLNLVALVAGVIGGGLAQALEAPVALSLALGALGLALAWAGLRLRAAVR